MNKLSSKNLFWIQTTLFIFINGFFIGLIVLAEDYLRFPSTIWYFLIHLIVILCLGILLAKRNWELQNRIIYPFLFYCLLVALEIVGSFFLQAHLEIIFKVGTLLSYAGGFLIVIIGSRQENYRKLFSWLLLGSSLLVNILPLIYAFLLLQALQISWTIPLLILVVIMLAKGLWFYFALKKQEPLICLFNFIYIIDTGCLFVFTVLFNFVYLFSQ
jgi:hypothetical protein